MIYLMFITAFALSATAAYYSIAGLVAIFAAAVVPIMVMGGTLEVAKLVVASWLYRNWKEVPIMMKSYFMVALIVLMTLTSMGIFGYLSKAHLDQAVPSGDIAAKVALIDEKIKTEKETIDAARKTITQLDSQVDQTIARTANDTTDKGVGRSVAIRKSQAKERKDLYSTIQTAQTEISKLNEERAPISTQLRKVEAEVGPIKYIAALIYGDNLDESFLEKAVRVVILLIVSVFDPLAVLMLVAANWSLKNGRKEEEPKVDMSYYSDSKWTEDELEENRLDDEDAEKWDEFFNENPTYELDDGPLSEEQLDTIKQEVGTGWDDKFYKTPEWLQGEDVIPSPAPPTIEQEVEQLQSPGTTIKEIQYDSLGRRITP